MPLIDQLRELPGIYDRDLKGVRVLLRLDCNVPMRDGRVHNDARLVAAIPTVRSLVSRGARVLVLAHLGRPDPDARQPEFSLAPVADWFAQELGQPVPLCRDWLASPPAEVAEGEVVLLENVRFFRGEIENSTELAQRLAGLCDLYVMEAFAVSHRANASTEAIIHCAPEVCPGPLMLEELDAIGHGMDSPRHPVVTIAGGAKVADKLPLLRNLANISDYIIPGGGIANTFLAAKGYAMGQSLYQAELLHQVREIMAMTQVLLPDWVVTAPSPDRDDATCIRPVDGLPDDESILDIAPRSVLKWEPLLRDAGTILWNGPLGMFERPAFAGGTLVLGRLIAESSGFSLAGGGDTLSAVSLCGIERPAVLSVHWRRRLPGGAGGKGNADRARPAQPDILKY